MSANVFFFKNRQQWVYWGKKVKHKPTCLIVLLNSTLNQYKKVLMCLIWCSLTLQRDIFFFIIWQESKVKIKCMIVILVCAFIWNSQWEITSQHNFVWIEMLLKMCETKILYHNLDKCLYVCTMFKLLWTACRVCTLFCPLPAELQAINLLSYSWCHNISLFVLLRWTSPVYCTDMRKHYLAKACHFVIRLENHVSV